MNFLIPIASLTAEALSKIPAGYRFGASRAYRNGTHMGIDMGKQGNTVRAAAAGTVRFAGWSSSNGGIMVYVTHPNNWETRYMHLAENSVRVSAGQKVTAGQVLGTAGNTGITTDPPHLHFEILQAGTNVDPLPLLVGGGASLMLLAFFGYALYYYMKHRG